MAFFLALRALLRKPLAAVLFSLGVEVGRICICKCSIVIPAHAGISLVKRDARFHGHDITCRPALL